MKLLLFRTTRHVITVEKLIRSRKLPFSVVPVPRSISSECGMAIEIEDEYIAEVKDIASEKRIEFRVHEEK